MKIKTIYCEDTRIYKGDISLESICSFVEEKYKLNNFKLTYIDDEDDTITMDDQSELTAAINVAEDEERKSLKIYIQIKKQKVSIPSNENDNKPKIKPKSLKRSSRKRKINVLKSNEPSIKKRKISIRQKCKGIGDKPRCKAFKDIIINNNDDDEVIDHSYLCEDCKALICYKCELNPRSDRKRDRWSKCHHCDRYICDECVDKSMNDTWLWSMECRVFETGECDEANDDESISYCEYGDCVANYEAHKALRKEQRKHGLVFCATCNSHMECVWC